MSLSLGGSRTLVCHEAKKTKVTFVWCGTEGQTGLYPGLSGLCVGMEGHQLLVFFFFFNLFFPTAFVTDSFLSKLLHILELEARDLPLCSSAL